jgi:hypothetical protein
MDTDTKMIMPGMTTFSRASDNRAAAKSSNRTARHRLHTTAKAL